MTCNEAIRKLSYDHIEMTDALRHHLRECADCRLLAQITAPGKVVQLPSRTKTPNTRVS